MTSRPWAYPLVPLYWAGLRLKDALRAARILTTHTLAWPVVSVGSLSAGGAGKTPAVLALTRLLADHGFTVNILSRGYGRTGTSDEQVDTNAPAAASRFGDEPTLLAAELPPPHTVWVGANRFNAGRKAESALTPQPASSKPIHLLDDGFQHRQLARTLDIVLVTAHDLDDTLLPAGNRREPLAALRRAHIVLLREEERPNLAPRLTRFLRPGALVTSHERHLVFPQPLASAGPRPLGFCGIARPRGFTRMLEDAGCTLVETIEFRDHCKYALSDVEHLVTAARANAATGFLTTQKDWVKFTPPMRDRLAQVGPVVVPHLHARLLDPQAILNTLEARLG